MSVRKEFITTHCPPSLVDFALANDETRATVICDSINQGVRITTLALRFPRFILPQFNTHRQFSRNSGSSRAIPTTRYIRELATYTPVFFKKNKPGMQGGEFLSDDAVKNMIDSHNKMATIAKESAIKLVQDDPDNPVAKEHVNRYLEPFSYVNVLVTSTYWENFFYQRCHPDSQPEIQLLALLIREAIEQSVPIERTHHLPYIMADELELPLEDRIKHSVSRCARVSYSSDFKNNKKSLSTMEQDERLYKLLVESDPPHLSPTEHIAFVDGQNKSSNFNPVWTQYRKTLQL